MSVTLDTVPDVHRPGVGAVLVSTWRVGSPERQQAAVDAITEAWRSRPWPDSGLLSYSVSVGTDGETLMHYSQWRDLAAYEHFVGNHRPERNAEIDAAVPDIQRLDLHTFTLERSVPPRDGTGPTGTPGCLVAVNVAFDGPDAERQRRWIDTVQEAVTATEFPRGVRHFHTSSDGTRVLAYAEWDSVAAHAEWLAGTGVEGGAVSEHWRRVSDFPGVVGLEAARYVPAVSFSAGQR